MNYRIAYGNCQCTEYETYAAARQAYLLDKVYHTEYMAYAYIQRYMGDGEWANCEGTASQPNVWHARWRE